MYTQSSLLKEINEALQELNFPSISQPTMSKIWDTHFPDVAFSKNTNFSKCSECIMLKAQMKTVTTKELVEKTRARLKKHNKIVMCGRYCYYAHIIMESIFLTSQIQWCLFKITKGMSNIIHKNVERDYWKWELTNCYRGM